MGQTPTLDAKNGNTLWVDATSKKLIYVRVAFEVLPDGKSVPIGHQIVQCCLVLDVKMEDVRCRARLLAGGQMTKAPATITHASDVSRETVRMVLMIAALNDFEVKLDDILNSYAQTPVTKKVSSTLGSAFGKDTRKTAVIEPYVA